MNKMKKKKEKKYHNVRAPPKYNGIVLINTTMSEHLQNIMVLF